MLGKRSGVATQIKCVQPKALETHCHGHSLNLSVKDATTSIRLMNDVLSTVAEITKLVKYSSKREQLLGTIQENFKLDDGDDEEKGCSLARLCVMRWTVKAIAFLKIINNFSQLYELWDTCLNENLKKINFGYIHSYLTNAKLSLKSHGPTKTYYPYRVSRTSHQTLRTTFL